MTISFLALNLNCFIFQSHFYQPMFTLVGAGHKPYSKTHRSQFGLIPEGVDLVEDRVTEFDPEKGHVIIGSGQKVSNFRVFTTSVAAFVCRNEWLSWRLIQAQIHLRPILDVHLHHLKLGTANNTVIHELFASTRNCCLISGYVRLSYCRHGSAVGL